MPLSGPVNSFSWGGKISSQMWRIFILMWTLALSYQGVIGLRTIALNFGPFDRFWGQHRHWENPVDIGTGAPLSAVAASGGSSMSSVYPGGGGARNETPRGGSKAPLCSLQTYKLALTRSNEWYSVSETLPQPESRRLMARCRII